MLVLSVVCVALLVLLPVAAAVVLRRRRLTPWALFFVGVATFIASQAVHLVVLYLLRRAGVLASGGATRELSLGVSLLLGALAGLCEEPARVVGYWCSRRARRVSDGVMLGLGHGGIEAMILGAVSTAMSLGAFYALRGQGAAEGADLGLSPEQAALARQHLDRIFAAPGGVLAVLAERSLALVLHVALSLVILRAFTRRSPSLVGLAIAYHTAVDAIAVFAAGRIESVWLLEALVAAMVAPGAIWVLRALRQSAPAERAAPALSWRAELAVFAAVLRKELWQLARTHRLLIAAVVFALLGLLAPLLARLTPDLLRAVGGPKLAAIAPEPSAFEALGQYIKQVTQIGLLVTVSLGVGSVASEKEKGTAILALCKPVPRWSFIVGKWAAQALVILASLLFAAVGTLFYTWVLFGPVNLGDFALITLILCLFLLCFATATLFASTLAKSVGAAVGLSLGAVAALFLLGALPGLSGLGPSGLLAWAQALARAPGAVEPANLASAAPNPGALAMGATLVVLLLLGAVALFEEQEL